MNKMFKKVSAVALAAAMTLGSSVAAQAATVKIYFREWHQNSTSNSYLGTPDTSTFGREPVFTVNNVKKGTTYKAVLDEAVENSDDDYVLTWTGTDGDYLKTITIGNKPWDNTGKNTEPDYDGDTMIGAIWVGSACGMKVIILILQTHIHTQRLLLEKLMFQLYQMEMKTKYILLF